MTHMTQLGITLTDQDRAQAAIVAKREAIFKAMRARLRDAGFQVKAVSWIRRQDDNEFAELPKWGWTGEMEEQFLDLVTRPGTRYFISRENDRAYWLAVAE